MFVNKLHEIKLIKYYNKTFDLLQYNYKISEL